MVLLYSTVVTSHMAPSIPAYSPCTPTHAALAQPREGRATRAAGAHLIGWHERFRCKGHNNALVCLLPDVQPVAATPIREGHHTGGKVHAGDVGGLEPVGSQDHAQAGQPGVLAAL